MRRPLSLGTRLALAFGGLFLAVAGLTAAMAAHQAGAAAEDIFHQRMASLVSAIPPSFVSNPDILARTKKLVGADVAAVSSPGWVGSTYAPQVESSLSPEDQAELLRFMISAEGDLRQLVTRSFPVSLGSRRCQVFGAWQGEGGGRRLVLLVVPQREIDRARAAAVAPVLWTMLAGAAAATVLAWALARSVSRPVTSLAAEAERAASGELAFRATRGGGREVELLGNSLERMSAELSRAREQALRSERAAVAGQLATALAHEVRNPLTGARLTVETLLSDERSEKSAEALRSVLEELERLERVVDDLVAFARPSPPVLARVDLSEVTGSVLALMKRQLEHAHVRSIVEADPSAVPARADAGKVRQVLMNLVLNAAQAMPRGGELSVRVRSCGADRVALEVTDSGPGVPAAELDRVFEPFYTTKPGGAGLGLSVSRRIAEEHGGRLSCEPGGAGRGASFRLELPVWKEKA